MSFGARWVLICTYISHVQVLTAGMTCTPEVAQAQLAKWQQAYQNQKWSACGSKEWLKRYYETSSNSVEIIFDIGCNKGYESGLIMSLFKPNAGVSAHSLYEIHEQQGRGLEGDLCGICDNCNEAITGTRQEEIHQDVHLYCFEPSLTNFRNLLNARDAYEDQLAAANLQWHLINSAVGPHVSLVKFPRSCGTTLCQVQEENADLAPHFEATFMTSVDAFREAEGLQHIDVLKIDTEGHDPSVILGSKATLEEKKVTLLYFEYHEVGLWKTVQLQDIIGLLDNLGYDCYFEGTPTLTVLTGCWLPVYEFKAWSNVVCANRDHPMAQELQSMVWDFVRAQDESAD